MYCFSSDDYDDDDRQVHSSEATTDIVNLATDLVTAYTGGQYDDDDDAFCGALL